MNNFEIFIRILKIILSGFIAGVVISIPLGPAGIESVKKSLSEGYKSGMIFILGSLMADLIYMLLLNKGLATIITSQTKRESLIFWVVSGAMLIVANFTLFKEKNKIAAMASKKSFLISYIYGFILTLLNPASVTVWITLSATSAVLWGARRHLHYNIFLWSAWLGMVAWFFILNYLAIKGYKLLMPAKKEKKQNRIERIIKLMTDNSIFFIGVCFMLYGFYAYFLK